LADKEAIIEEAAKIVYEQGEMFRQAHKDHLDWLRQQNKDRFDGLRQRKNERYREMYETLEMERKGRDVAKQEIIAAKLEGRPVNLSKTKVDISGFLGNNDREIAEDADRRFDEFEAELEATERFADKLTHDQARAQRPMAAASSTVESDFSQDELPHGVTTIEAPAAAETTYSPVMQTEQLVDPADESASACSAESTTVDSMRAEAPADSVESTDGPMLQSAQESPTTDSSTEAVSMASRQEEQHAAAQDPSAGDVTTIRTEPTGALAEQPLWWALQAAAVVPI